MFRTATVGLCRRCRAGQAGCCQPRRRTPTRRQIPQTCGHCRKDAHPTESAAIDAAIAAAREQGVTHMVFLCPHGRGFHTASKRYRRTA